jgi:hypothetical protein
MFEFMAAPRGRYEEARSAKADPSPQRRVDEDREVDRVDQAIAAMSPLRPNPKIGCGAYWPRT